ncbi:6915_t:CDS:1, partial [Ambispora leptoticha]
MKKNKTYHLTIKTPQLPPFPLTLALTPPNQRGECFKCYRKKEIYIVSERPIGLSWEVKKFCRECALSNLDESEQGDYEFENKAQIIKEIRKALEKSETLLPQEKENLLE